MLKNRSDAGKKLAERLLKYKGKDAIVLALPRGGVAVGYEVAKALNLPMDIVSIRKVGHPSNPEYAICAVDDKGHILRGDASSSVDPDWLEEAIEKERAEALRRSEVYRSGSEPLDIKDKIIILTDDGVATGLTFRLALSSCRSRQPAKIISAIPIAPPETVKEISGLSEEVVLLENPGDFRGAVGAHYEQFEQMTDNEVIRFMQESVLI